MTIPDYSAAVEAPSSVVTPSIPPGISVLRKGTILDWTPVRAANTRMAMTIRSLMFMVS